MKLTIKDSKKYISQDQERYIVLVDIVHNNETFTVPFYKSTGINSGNCGKWYPFLGILNEEFLKYNNLTKMLNMLYRGGVDQMKKNHSERWFIKFPGTNDDGVERMAMNKKYGEMFEKISKGIPKIEMKLQVQEFKDQIFLSRHLVKKLRESGKRSYYVWVAAHCKCTADTFSEWDLLK